MSIRDRVIAIASDVLERELLKVCAEDRLRVTAEAEREARQRIRSALDGVGDCKSFERMSDPKIRAGITPHLRTVLRDALAAKRPS